MTNVQWWTEASKTLLHFLGIEGSSKRFNYIEHHEGEAERKSSEAPKDAAPKEEMVLIFKYNFDRKKHLALFH